MSDTINNGIIPVALEDEMKNSYLTYAMSVIVSRALPDVRDGLKPVHRRILYSMNNMGLHYSKETRKCARIVGDVLGKYHPHGDASVYDALVRLAQDFSMRYPVVWGQGNFGSIDGDPPAAMRYTEAKLQKIADEMLRDIKKDTVDFVPNYDESEVEPTVLPAGIPYLLVNGSSGIAVGMATNMPPHNLNEVLDGVCAYIDNPDITVDQLMEYIKGPDFPTGATIFGTSEIKKAYKTGKGSITIRSKCEIETTKNGRDIIVFKEIPYAVNKQNLVKKIDELKNEGVIDGISSVDDESGRKEKVRIVIHLKAGAVPKVVLNQLYTHTQLQVNFNVNNLALVKGKPQLLNLKDLIAHYVAHRKEVVTRRVSFDLKEAEARAHILEGLKIALENIDEVIAIIKASPNTPEAKIRLIDRFQFSEIQAQAILDMRLQKLTSLETQKILDELAELYRLIAYYKELLADEGKLYALIKQEFQEIQATYGNPRSTEITIGELENINVEDLITKENVAVMISNKGFIKRIPVSAYKNQARGGKGSLTSRLSTDDFMEHLFIASTHENLMFISSEGKAYYLKVHEIPEASRTTKGVQIKALINISPNEDISAIVAVKNFSDSSFLLMGTRKGVIKRMPINLIVNAKKRGITAINLDSGDRLMSAELTSGKDELFMVSRKGIILRFNESLLRPLGRASKGVKGINLSNDDELIAVLTGNEENQMLLLTEFGYGKRMKFNEITPHGRGTKGQIGYKVGAKTGEIIGAISVKEEQDVLCITSQGIAIKTKCKNLPILGRAAMGVKIINIEKPDFLVGVAPVVKENDEKESDDNEILFNKEKSSSEEQ